MPNKLKSLLSRKVQFAFGSAILALLVVGAVSYRGIVLSSESDRWLLHTHEVLANLHDLGSAMEQAESSCHGFVLTGDESYFETNRATRLTIAQDEKSVRNLTANNPNQQNQLAALERLTAEKFVFEDLVMSRRRAQGLQAAADVIRGGSGQRIATALLEISRKMQGEELRLLALRSADSKRRLAQIKMILVFGTVLGLLITAVAGWSVQRDSSDRMAADKYLAQMEGRYRGLLEAAPDAMVVVNPGGEIVLLNVQAEKEFGYRRDELVGQKVKNIIPEGFAERIIADGTRSAAEALAQQIGTGIELIGRRKNGSEFPIEIMLSPLESPEGILVTAAIRNISVRKTAEIHLAQMEGQYRGLLEAAPDAMVVVNQWGEIVLLNVQAEKQFGYRRHELIRQKVTNIIPEGFAERLIADALRSAEDALAQQIGTGIELIGRRKNGSEFPIELMLSPLASAEGVLVTAAIRDITTRKKAEAQMIYSSEHDFLTGLPNRMLLNDRLNQAILLARRHSRKIAVLFLDLDGFKHINDSLGHRTGDKLLQSVGKRLVECVRGSDTVSRQGGDEFVVLLSEEEESEDAALTARRMLRRWPNLIPSTSTSFMSPPASASVSIPKMAWMPRRSSRMRTPPCTRPRKMGARAISFSSPP